MSVVALDRFMSTLAARSGEVILPFFRSMTPVVDKSAGKAFDPVTEADRSAELVIRRLIREAFPSHGIQGEEFGLEEGDGEYRWIIDPIDGTKAFISGLPLWGTLVGLTKAGSPVYGMMNQPWTGELFLGDGAKATITRGGETRTLAVRPCESLSVATISTTAPGIIKGADRTAYDAVEGRCRLARYGADCYAYCMVAAGLIDIVVETSLKPHDVAALIPIVEGAGGVMTTWEGAPAIAGGRIIACGDRRVHAEALALLEKHAPGG
jgi:histidinol phosphatase-like enzyme (inositol monophosphatase family)